MAKGCFVVNRNANNDRDIRFSIAQDAPEPAPSDQRKIRQVTEETLTILRLLFPKGEGDQRFEEYFNRLLGAAQAGTVGNNARPKEALEDIEALQADVIATEAPRRRGKYLKVCLFISLILAIFSASFGLWLIYWAADDAAASVGRFLLYFATAIMGSWGSLVMSNTGFKFEDLISPDKDQLSATIRMIFYSLILAGSGILTASEILVINLGRKASSAIVTDNVTALVMGIIFGFGITPLTSRIYRLVDDKIRVSK